MTRIIGSDDHKLSPRRDFLKTAALAGGGLALGGTGLHLAEKLIHPPNAYGCIPGTCPTYINVGHFIDWATTKGNGWMDTRALVGAARVNDSETGAHEI